MTLHFPNPGAADIRALTVIGVNVKDSPGIGEFGTGFKCAVAKILALGGSVQAAVGGPYGIDVFEFCTKPVEIRGQMFGLVTVSHNKQEEQSLGFTTALGKHWEPWMAYRELRSNMMLDEGGGFDWQSGDEAWTTIIVDCPEVEATHAEGGKYFLESEALWVSEDLEVHPAREDGGYFYRGIKVGSFAEPGLFTYNMLAKQQLTEDQTLGDWNANYAITMALALCTSQPIAEAVLLAKPQFHEAKFDWDYTGGFSEVARKTLVLHRYNADVHRGAYKRASALYSDDYASEALAMSTADLLRAEQTKDLFTQLGLPCPGMPSG